MTKPTTTIDHQELDTVVPSLPSLNIDHAAVYANETQNRIAGFDAGITTIRADMDGMTERHERMMAERARILKDMERGRKMAVAAMEAYSAPIPGDGE